MAAILRFLFPVNYKDFKSTICVCCVIFINRIIGNFKECFKKCEISTFWIIFSFYKNNCNSNIEPGPNSPLPPIFDPNLRLIAPSKIFSSFTGLL